MQVREYELTLMDEYARRCWFTLQDLSSGTQSSSIGTFTSDDLMGMTLYFDLTSIILQMENNQIIGLLTNKSNQLTIIDYNNSKYISLVTSLPAPGEIHSITMRIDQDALLPRSILDLIDSNIAVHLLSEHPLIRKSAEALCKQEY